MIFVFMLATFVGFQSGEDLADHYAAADLFAFASKTETFGNVVLEAMASGLPAVVLAAGGPAEIVHHGRDGLALDPEAPPSAFADALVGLCEDRPRRLALAESARSFACSQGWDRIMMTLRDRYASHIAATDREPAPIA